MNSFFLIGYFGFYNVGDSLILQIFIQRMKKKSKQIFFLSGPEFKMNSQPFGAIPVFRHQFLRIINLLCNKDLILVAPGGELFQSRTSMISCLYYCLFFFFVRLLGRKYALLFQGYDKGTFKNIIVKIIFSFIEQKAFFVSWRDRPLPASDEKGSDILFLSKLKPLKQKREKTVVVCLSRYSERWKHHFLKIVSDFKSKGFIPLYLPFHRKQDLSFCQWFQKNCKGTLLASDDLAVDITKIASIFSKSSYVITTRYHAAVLSVLTNTPFYYPAGDEKSRLFYSHFNQSDNLSQIKILSNTSNICSKSAFLSFQTVKRKKVLMSLQKNAETQFYQFLEGLYEK